MITSAIFENFIIICVIVNSIYLAIEGIIADDTIDLANKVFTIFFFIEMIWKLIAFGITCFFFIIIININIDYWKNN